MRQLGIAGIETREQKRDREFDAISDEIRRCYGELVADRCPPWGGKLSDKEVAPAGGTYPEVSP